jgi:pimeloyl-ACP methyl ester carboxylesterase
MELTRALLFVTTGLAIAACGDDGATTHDAGPDGKQVDAPPPPPDAPVTPVVPRAEPTACRYDVPVSLGVEGQAFSCGDLVVYENRAAKGRTIKVHYIKFESASASPNATIYLDGGPGGDGQNILSYAAVLGAPFIDGLRVDGDFLVISQRGTARSLPFLDCQQFDCADFSSSYDLPSYNTAENADDVDDLRAVLGYPKLNVYGISYGSRLGLEVLRRHGDNVRAAVIEGLVPSSIAWPAGIPASFYSAITALGASCTAAGGCGTAFGNLVTKFSAGVAALNANPVTIMIQGTPFDLDGYTYASLLFRLMYSKSTFTWLPMVISDLAERRTDRIETFLSNVLSSVGGGSSISTGLYNSVVCGEIFSPPDANAPAVLNAGVPTEIVEIFGGSWFSLQSTCETWPAGNHQAALAVPVTSAVRTLVSSGSIDPITPPAYGDIAAATLSSSVVVVHANSGHGATLQSTCGTLNLTQFLADPTTPHDTSCAAAITTTYMLPTTFAAPPVSYERIRAEMGFAPRLPRLRR